MNVIFCPDCDMPPAASFAGVDPKHHSENIAAIPAII
jgi:hypothetical protein